MSEQKSKTIRVSEDTFKMLGKQRDGFETPDECLKRILVNKPCVQRQNQETGEINEEI